MYARGLSMRAIEAAFTDERGRGVLTRSAASRGAERLGDDYQEFASRDLSELRIVYLYVDGGNERLHLGQPREAVLAAWGIDGKGTKHLLGLQPGTKEDTESCRDFLRGLKARGLNDPLLVVTDGAPGLIRAAQQVLPRSLRPRCLAHELRNLQSKVPEERWRDVLPAVRARCIRPAARRWRNSRRRNFARRGARSCRRRWHALTTTSTLASPTCGCRWRIGGWREPRIGWIVCSARNAGAPRRFRTPSANAP